MGNTEKMVTVVAGKRNIFTSQGKVLAEGESKPIPQSEAKGLVKDGLASVKEAQKA